MSIDQLTFGSLDAVSLDEATAAADLQTRVDRKYLVDPAVFLRVVEGFGQLRALDIDDRRQFDYESVYFDTPVLASYLSAARGRRRRFKVRTRSYLDSGRCLLEVKVRNGRDETVKQHIECSIYDRYRLTDDGCAFVGEHVDLPCHASELRPTLTTRYRRSTLVDDDARITVDSGLVCTRWEGDSVELGGVLIVETKSNGPTTRMDRALWAAGIRPASFSKYGVGMAALDSSLPANKWNTVLRRHFDWHVPLDVRSSS